MHFNAVLAESLVTNEARYKTMSDAAYTVTGGRGDVENCAYPVSSIDALTKDYQEYKVVKDALGIGSLARQVMYNPMYYLNPSYAGYKTSLPAAHWRINAGITQTDTSSTVEMNQALALQQYGRTNGGVKDVALTMVWNQGHIFAKRTGSSTDNFIRWVNSCTK